MATEVAVVDPNPSSDGRVHFSVQVNDVYISLSATPTGISLPEGDEHLVLLAFAAVEEFLSVDTPRARLLFREAARQRRNAGNTPTWGLLRSSDEVYVVGKRYKAEGARFDVQTPHCVLELTVYGGDHSGEIIDNCDGSQQLTDQDRLASYAAVVEYVLGPSFDGAAINLDLEFFDLYWR